MHDLQIQDHFERSLQQIIWNQWNPVPYRWRQNEKLTIFEQAYYGIIPDIKGHRSNEMDPNGFTVAMILAINNINIPKEWEHRPDLKNNYRQTVAMYMAKNYVIPPKQWMHDLTVMYSYFQKMNFQSMLKTMKLPVPQHWNDEQKMTIFDQACYRIIPDVKHHTSDEQNDDGFTVAMILAINNIEVPQQWQHKPKIQNKYKQTVFDIYVQKQQIPPQWCCRKPEHQDEQGLTQAMILAKNNIEIPEYLYHDPNIISNENYTVALYQAKNGKIPDKQWYHNKLQRGPFVINNILLHYTVQNFLKYNEITVPKEWQYDNVVDDKDNTKEILQIEQKQIPDYKTCLNRSQTNMHNDGVASVMIYQNIIPSKEWIQNPESKYGDFYETIAMMLAFKQSEIPKYCYHNPTIQDFYGNTVAMKYAEKRIIPPKEWHHEPLLHNFNNQTVAIILASRGIVPPNEWMHDITLKFGTGYSIMQWLYEFGYSYKDNQFVPNCKTQITNETCQICFSQGEQEFVLTTCGHNICIECFKNLIQFKKIEKCPICRQKEWYKQIKVLSQKDRIAKDQTNNN